MESIKRTTPKLTETSVQYRAPNQEDVNFIFNSWLKSNRHAKNIFDVPNPVYFSQHHVLVEGLLKRSNVIIACNPIDSAQIYGFISYETIEDSPVVHYVYVKEAFRKLGLCKMLIKRANIDYDKPFFVSHFCKIALYALPHYPLVYNPYLAFDAYTEARKPGVKSEAKKD